jgi:undecaprenyl phosphate-alpha-L-ara4N flippase subunit ArnE
VSLHLAPALTPAALLLLAFCLAAEIARELFFKVAADRAATRPNYAAAVVASPLAWAGVALWLVEIVGWVASLQRTPLNVAFSIITLTYVGVPIAAALVLKERLVKRQVAGAALIVLGVLCVGLSGKGG